MQNRKLDLDRIGLPILIGLAVLVVVLLGYSLTRPDRSQAQIAAGDSLERQMDASQARAASKEEARAKANQDAMR